MVQSCRELAMLRLPADEPRDCPERPHDTFLAHVALPEVTVFVDAPSASYGSGELVRSSSNSREGMELIVRAPRPRKATAALMWMLVHSPLVGRLTWQPVAARLRQRGSPVVVPSLIEAFDSGPPYYCRLAISPKRCPKPSVRKGPVPIESSWSGTAAPGRFYRR